jgi:murein DD-endopeptidase MepM/ murein hydrolase activator NlpD
MRVSWSKAILLATTVLATPGLAQQAPDLAGRWEGALKAGATTLRVVLDVSRTVDGLLLGTLTSLDQGNSRIPIDRIDVKGQAVHFEASAVRGSYDGTVSADGARISGTWTQGAPLPLELTRVAAPDSAARAPAPAPADPAKPSPGVSPFGAPLEMTIPTPPIPFVGNGQTHLVYEIHLTNFAPVDVALRRIDVLSGNDRLASFEGVELNSILRPVGGAPGAGSSAAPTDARTLGAGRRAVTFVWITLGKGAPTPSTLRHWITTETAAIESRAIDLMPPTPLVIGPPLRGAPWVAANGPANATGHRQAMFPLDGRIAIGQRYAIDWVKVDMQGRTFDGDAKTNTSYFAYGQDAIAVADATVAAIKDGIPENLPDITSRAVPITRETIGGNFVVLDLGGNRYAFYAHLQPGSLKVKPGDRVRRGQVLGLVGNSGNSTEPHLHFHVSDGPDSLASEGLPYAIDRFEVASSGASFEMRQREIPMNGAVVRFADGK